RSDPRRDRELPRARPEGGPGDRRGRGARARGAGGAEREPRARVATLAAGLGPAVDEADALAVRARQPAGLDERDRDGDADQAAQPARHAVLGQRHVGAALDDDLEVLAPRGGARPHLDAILVAQAIDRPDRVLERAREELQALDLQAVIVAAEQPPDGARVGAAAGARVIAELDPVT